MKKITCLLAALLLMCGLTWAQTDVLNHDVIGVPSTTYQNWSDLTLTSGAVYAGNTAGGNDAIQMRSSNNNSGIVTTTSAGIVTNITVVWNSNTNSSRVLNVYGSNTAYEAASDLYGSNAGTLIGSIAFGDTELAIDDEYAFIGIRSSNGALWLDEIQITWAEGGTPAPSITIEGNNELAYDATSGSFTFTVNNPVTGGELTVTEDVEWISNAIIAENSVTYTTTVNEEGASREGVITLTYSYGETRETVTKNVTVTQAGNPNVVDNISDITEVNANYHVKGMVVATSKRGFIICDGTGLVYTYLNAAPTQQVGDFVQITGTTGSYGHVIQFTNNATIAEAEEFIFDWPDYTVITEVPDYTEGYHLSDYFQFEGALTKSGSNYLVAVGEGQIRISYPTTEQAADLETLLNKTVRIHGFFTGYSGTGSNAVFTAMMESYEEVTSTDPSITIATYTLNVDAEEHEGTINVTYANVDIEIEMAEVMLCNAEGEPATYDWIQSTLDDNHNIGYNISANEGEARTAYLKVCIYEVYPDVISFSSDIVTVNQAEYVAPSLDYAELPFAFNGGKADIEGTDGLTQNGLGTDYGSAPKLKFDNTGDWLLLHFLEAPGTLTFDIKGNSFNGGTFTVQTSVDGETYEDLAEYTDFGTNGTELKEDETFSLGENVRYIKWIYTNKSQGNVGLGDITLDEPAAPVPSITFTPDVFNFDAEQHVLQIPFTYENIEVTDYASFTTHFYNAEGEEIQLIPGEAWYYCSVTGNNAEGYQLTGVVTANEGEARSAYMKVSALDAAGETVYSNLVTVNQAAPVVPPVPGEWVMSSLKDLTEDDVFVIVGVYDADESSYAMPNNSANAPSAVEVTMVGNTLSGDIADNLKWNISIGEDGYTFYPNGETETWLYCTNTNNGVRVGTNENNVFSMTTEGYLFNNATGRYIGIYNYQDWRCYTSINNNIKNQTFAFYKRVDESEIETYTLDITGYDTLAGGYYLIASPVSMIRPTEENGFLTNEYDLYYFDQAQQGYEWRNYEAQHFNIVSCKGYLYASQENTTLTFTGIPYEGNGEVVLDYVGDTTWNLIGNPVNVSSTLSDELGERDFYIMNPEGTEIVAAERSFVYPMEGVFVQAIEENEKVYFSWNSGIWGGDPITKLNLRVSDNNGHGDFARIRFGEGRTLSKFQLNPNSTKLYFTQDGNDYAVVRSEAEGEMPVNFKAGVDGTYTLSINVENIEMEYLHLIDNMTGMEIDLLETPEYSFNARVNDNANRFKLVFASITGMDENNAEQFAFFSNGSLVVSNEGNAMLQVIDITGRIVKSESINGNANVNIDAAPGVYTLRLVNGNDVKVQKVVVK